jgi:hypothetical protein
MQTQKKKKKKKYWHFLRSAKESIRLDLITNYAIGENLCRYKRIY